MSTLEGGGRLVTDGLVLYMDYTNPKCYISGNTTCNDLSSNQIIGNISGTTYSGNSLYFNGVSNNYILCNSQNPITGTSAFSMCGFLNVRTHSDFGIAFFIGNGATYRSAYIGYALTSLSGGSTNNTIGGGFYGHNFGTGISANTGWHYAVLTFAGGTNGSLKMYLDNVLRISTNFTPTLSATSITLGRANTAPPSSYPFNGNIGLVQLYNRALSQAEITQNYNTLRKRFNI